MYAGVVLGGIGSTLGAFWGGMAIGLVQQLSTLVLPTQLQNSVIFVVFLVIVILRPQGFFGRVVERRSEEHTSELQSLMRISYAVFCLKKKKKLQHRRIIYTHI